MATQEINLGEDDGFADVTICGVTQRIDCAKSHAQIYQDQQKTHGGDWTPFYDAVTKRLVELGYPEVSHKMAVMFVRFLNSRMKEAEEREKAEDAAAEAPAGEGPA